MLWAIMGGCPDAIKELKRLKAVDLIHAAMQKHGVSDTFAQPREVMTGFALGAAGMLMRPGSQTGSQMRANASRVVRSTVDSLPVSEYRGYTKLPTVIEAMNICQQANERIVPGRYNRNHSMGATHPGLIIGTDEISKAQKNFCNFRMIEQASKLRSNDVQNAVSLKEMRWSPWPFPGAPDSTHGNFLKIALGERLGARPITTSSLPFAQRSAQTPDHLYGWLVDQIESLPAFTTSRFFEMNPSKLSEFRTSTRGFHLSASEVLRTAASKVTFVASREFGYMHARCFLTCILILTPLFTIYYILVPIT